MPFLKQISFSRLWDGFETDVAARAARDAEATRWRKLGYQVKRWTLRNQLKPYDGLGQPNGNVCHCYMLNVEVR